MNHGDLIQHMNNTFDDCIDIARSKNQDYAQDSDAFANFRQAELVGVDPDRAILVRISDKLARISNSLNDDLQVEDETIEDTLNDIINYSAILKAYIENE